MHSLTHSLLRFARFPMAEQSSSEVNPPQSPPFVEVLCRSSGKKHRFAIGTKAGFALSLVNRKLDTGGPCALYVEATKEGEEPISFGPDAPLVAFRDNWDLQTVREVDLPGIGKRDVSWPSRTQLPIPNVKSYQDGKEGASQNGLVYVAKILSAFILMFVLGAILTLCLENLPSLILFLKSLF